MSDVSYLGSGYAAEAYLLRAQAGKPGPPSGRSRGVSATALVLRLPKAPQSHTAPLLQCEARLLPLLERYDLGVTTPRGMRAVREGRTFLGTIHELVEGAPFPVGLRGAAREHLCAGIGWFLAALHTVPVEVAERADVRSVDLWEDVYRGLIEQAMPHLGPATQAWLSRTARAFGRRGTRHAPRVLVHGDISRAHLLGDAEGNLVGAIDFGEARIADPALDFAGVLNDLDWRDLERVWVHYRAAGGVVDSDAARRVRFYIAVVPLYRVVYGCAAEGPAERAGGIRQLVARAAAATRRGG